MSFGHFVRRNVFPILGLVLSISAGGSALAAVGGNIEPNAPAGIGAPPPGFFNPEPRSVIQTPPLHFAFADDITQAMVNRIKRGAAECRRLDSVYRIDCLRAVLSDASGAAGRRPDYSVASSELRKLSRSLKSIVSKNQDRNAPKAKLGRKSYRAVAKEALRQANRQASQAIDEAVTKLLRSAGNSQKRKVHYTRIANAVNSTKTILRS